MLKTRQRLTLLCWMLLFSAFAGPAAAEELFQSPLLSILVPEGWETGIVATLDPNERRAIRQTEQYVPAAY